MSLTIESAFGIVRIEALATARRRRYGVPPGGPFDRESAALANALAGNAPDAPVVELSNATLSLRATAPVVVALAGALPFGWSPGLGRVSLSTGDRLDIAASTEGARTYLAGHGGWEAAALTPGAEIRARRAGVHLPPARLAFRPNSLERGVLRCVPGPQAEQFSDQEWITGWTVSSLADRVGVRLEGRALRPGPESASEPACPGAVQVTNDGQLIILGPDGPTIGGYPKIAVVCDADLDKVGQLRPGDPLRFEVIDLEEARRAAEAFRAALARTVSQIALTGRPE